MTEDMIWKNRIVGYGEESPEQLVANPLNWRIHSAEQQNGLQGVLEEVGIVQNIIVNKNTGFVVDGHLRVALALRTSQKTLPVTYVELSEMEERKIIATFDSVTALANTDREKLAEILKEADAESERLKGLYSTIIDKERLDQFYNADKVEEDEPPIEQANELLKLWRVEPGQLWEIQSKAVTDGCHRIICGDSRDPELFKRLMHGEKARMVWTDPLYGVNYNGSDTSNPHHDPRHRVIENDNLQPNELEELIRKTMQNCAEHTMEGATFYMASPSGNRLPTLIKSIDNSGFMFHWLLIWLKDSIVLSRGDYHFRHENILYGWKPKGAHYFTADRTQASVFEYPRPKVSEEHPTMKPVGLVAHHIKNSSREGEIIIDQFCGSGTTLAACERVRRLGRGIELDPAYVAVILQRLTDLGCQAKLAEW